MSEFKMTKDSQFLLNYDSEYVQHDSVDIAMCCGHLWVDKRPHSGNRCDTYLNKHSWSGPVNPPPPHDLNYRVMISHVMLGCPDNHHKVNLHREHVPRLIAQHLIVKQSFFPQYFLMISINIYIIWRALSAWCHISLRVPVAGQPSGLCWPSVLVWRCYYSL